MLSEKLLKAINTQIEHELFSSNLYLSMAAYFETKNLPGFAAWMRVQSDEERAHALKFFDYLHDVGAQAKIHAHQRAALRMEQRTGCVRTRTNPREESHQPDPQPVRDCPAGQGLCCPVDAEMVHRRAGGRREERQPDR